MRYVRHKPGRALHILHDVRAVAADGSSATTLSLLTLDERVAGPVSPRTLPSLLDHVGLLAAGKPSATPAGVTVHTLPDDLGLPALRAAWAPQPGAPLCRSLESMLTAASGDRAAIVAITAIPRHYKPASRCVIEYRLRLRHDDSGEEFTRVLYGKLFAKPAQACEMDAGLRRVAETWDRAGPLAAWTPRSLGVYEPLGMCFTQAADEGRGLSGMALLRPGGRARIGAAWRAASIPEAALELSAAALARLHTASFDVSGLELRSAAYESERAVERARLLAAYTPEMESEIMNAATTTARSLVTLDTKDARACHGSYKRSQLVYGAGTLTVVDWDSLCIADPAIDLGCFLAHLRPSALWYARPGARAWFSAAAAYWIQAYVDGMAQRGQRSDVVSGIVSRSAAYEAAMLLKMATRRLRRLNSPRPGELRAILSEVGRCLSTDAAA
ncbi:MAG TPA: phosphotransferase [Candidatus Dormibacteraeota bacterium]|nr:phosphotransferase [Candidatus Dormibacteraeota bacterium]